MTPPENDLRDAVADPALRKEVRDCIGETIPLRRRWVSAIIAGPITRLLTRSTAAETDLAKARADLERVTAERDAETERARYWEEWRLVERNMGRKADARVIAAEAEIARLNEGMAARERANDCLTEMVEKLVLNATTGSVPRAIIVAAGDLLDTLDGPNG